MTHSSSILHGLSSSVLLFSTALACAESIDPNVRGRVTSADDRPLPYVVVTSRTSNGFLSTRSDLSGNFAFAGRRHAPRGELSFQSAGYVTQSLTVADDTMFVHVELHPDSQHAASRWMIGLVRSPEIRMTAPDGNLVSVGDTLVVGRPYELEVVSQGSGSCTRRGPGDVSVDSTSVTVGVAEFVRGGACTRDIVQHSWKFQIVMQQPGHGEIRVIGRTRDQLTPIVVAPE